jgi:hypothetical protein
MQERCGRLRGLSSCPIGGARWLTDGLGRCTEDGIPGSVPRASRVLVCRGRMSVWIVRPWAGSWLCTEQGRHAVLHCGLHSPRAQLLFMHAAAPNGA